MKGESPFIFSKLKYVNNENCRFVPTKIVKCVYSNDLTHIHRSVTFRIYIAHSSSKITHDG